MTQTNEQYIAIVIMNKRNKYLPISLIIVSTLTMDVMSLMLITSCQSNEKIYLSDLKPGINLDGMKFYVCDDDPYPPNYWNGRFEDDIIIFSSSDNRRELIYKYDYDYGKYFRSLTLRDAINGDHIITWEEQQIYPKTAVGWTFSNHYCYILLEKSGWNIDDSWNLTTKETWGSRMNDYASGVISKYYFSK